MALESRGKAPIMPTHATPAQEPPLAEKAGSALFYAVTSLVLVSANKQVLTAWAFPSSNFMAFSQFSITCVALHGASRAGLIRLDSLTPEVVRETLPLSVLFFLDTLCGLGGTKIISLPMFTVLRRFSVLITMLLEMAVGQSRPGGLVKGSVVGMVVGAVIAAHDDLAFNFLGYLLLMLNNLFTACRGVYLKHAVTQQRVSKLSLLYYNALFSVFFMLAIFAATGEHRSALSFERWTSTAFCTQFLMACGLGPVLQFSIFLCTNKNSALTTTVVGCLKNVLVVYLGFFVGGDYVFSFWNFTGIQISVVASLVYSFATFRPKT